MRFTSILFALPLVASVFGSPVPSKDTDLEERGNSGLQNAGNQISTILTNLNVNLGNLAGGIKDPNANVDDILGQVDQALQNAYQQIGTQISTIGSGGVSLGGLGVGVGAGLNVQIGLSLAKVLAQLAATVSNLLSGFQGQSCVPASTTGLLTKIQADLVNIVNSLQSPFPGLLAALKAQLSANGAQLLGGLYNALNLGSITGGLGGIGLGV